MGKLSVAALNQIKEKIGGLFEMEQQQYVPYIILYANHQDFA